MRTLTVLAGVAALSAYVLHRLTAPARAIELVAADFQARLGKYLEIAKVDPLAAAYFAADSIHDPVTADRLRADLARYRRNGWVR